jgi:hypothetical protein
VFFIHHRDLPGKEKAEKADRAGLRTGWRRASRERSHLKRIDSRVLHPIVFRGIIRNPQRSRGEYE